MIGAVSFSGSLIAFAKLQELMTGRPIIFPGNQFINGALLLGIVFLVVYLATGEESEGLFVAMLGAALVFGVLLIIPVGGADMPVVISMLNAFTGPVRRGRRLRARQHRADHRRARSSAPRERCSRS